MDKPLENSDLPPVVSKALASKPGCALQVAHSSRQTVNIIGGSDRGTEEQRRSYYIACPATASSPPSRELVYVEARERTLPPGMGLAVSLPGDLFGDGGGLLRSMRELLRSTRSEPEPPRDRKGPPGEGGGVRV